ncbi:Membrane fusion protein (MFP) family protein [uncultured Gammaproteobacteria bacterium]
MSEPKPDEIRPAAEATEPAAKPASPIKPARPLASARRNELLEFLPGLVEIQERPVPRAATLTLLTIVGLIVFAITWASLAQIDRVIVAEGRLITSSNKIVVQPLESGIIRAINIRVGQVVRKGDILALLDATFAEADTTASRESLTSLEAQVARLEAQLSGKRAAAHFSEHERENTLQADIFTRHQAEVAANLASLDGEIGALSAELETNKREQVDALKTTEITRQVEQMRQTLIERNAGSQLQLLEAKSHRITAERDYNRLINAARQVGQKLNATRERRGAYAGEMMGKIAQELQATRRERDKVAEDLKKHERRSNLVQLTAPDDAVVLELAQRSVGSMANQAEPLITLVPLGAPLEAEVEVLPQDVALLRTGDPVRIKLDALPYQQHGTLSGRLDVISGDVIKADRGPNGQQMFIYRARVAITEAALRHVPEYFHLIPGMAASAEIKIGSRRVITYFIYPIFRALDESFREP